MSIYSTPSPYLSRLQDLKLWQGNYDALLQCKATDTSHLSDYDTIDLSGIDSTKSSLATPQKSKNTINQSIDWDQKTILQMKPFEQLLEEKLAEEQPVIVHSKPKKPYLKKGTGLLRYKSVNKPRNSRCSKRSRNTYHSDVAIQNELLSDTMSPKHKSCLKNQSSVKKSSSVIDITPLTMPEVSIRPKATWCQVGSNLNGSRSPRANNGAKKKTVLNTIDEYSYQKMIPTSPQRNRYDPKVIKKTVEQRNDIPKTRSIFESSEDGELKIFEALEERVEHPSFSPNNASIIRLLSSTPTKARMKLFDSPKKAAAPEPHAERSPEQHKSRAKEEQAQSKRYSDSAQQCDELRKKMEILDVNDLVLTNFLDNLKKFVETERMEDAKKEMLDEGTNTSTSGKWSTDSEDRSPSSSFYTDFESTLRSKAPVRVNAAMNTSFEVTRGENLAPAECENCKELLRKLEKLQKQIPDVQAEKARVCDFAKELEKKRDQLHLEIDRLKRKYDADVQDLRRELVEEKRTFAKEKAIFEMYIKEAQNRPTKKEREEISNLKQELISVKELMKLKDTKNGATTARLRAQVKQLEKERAELKSSVEALQKENAKLNASRKTARPVEVKMLQEINKNLTKLAEETLRKQNCNSDTTGTEENSPSSSSRTSSTGNNNGTQRKSPPKKSSFRSNVKRSQNTLVNDAGSYKEDHFSLSNADVEKNYETVFGQFEGDINSPSSFNSSKHDRVENTFPDGSKEIKYSNGNVKSISPDGKLIIVQYYNGDVKETNKSENTLKYYYAENHTWHTQFGDGSELIEYSNGQKEKKYKDGKREITCPDGVFLTKLPDGTEETSYPDGSKLIKKCNRERILILPNGQKEYHTTEHMRREYPDGTVKIVYPNGTQETRYATGRIRIKDESGTLIMDSEDA